MGSYEFQCYANCDGSGPPVLSVNDYTCFMNRYAAGDPWANCDPGERRAPRASDFLCFLQHFRAGCGESPKPPPRPQPCPPRPAPPKAKPQPPKAKPTQCPPKPPPHTPAKNRGGR